jgi:hypothetical protein
MSAAGQTGPHTAPTGKAIRSHSPLPAQAFLSKLQGIAEQPDGTGTGGSPWATTGPQLMDFRTPPARRYGRAPGMARRRTEGAARRDLEEMTQEFYSISELANRWRCSRGTVYSRLRAEGAHVLDFASPGKKGRKAVPVPVVSEIESRRLKLLR